MENPIKWWLGDYTEKFENGRHVLDSLDFDAEARLDREIKKYTLKNLVPGHGFDHHERVRDFATVIGIVNGADTDTIQTCRYAASVHDILKESRKGGKGSHNWSELEDLTREFMKRAKVDTNYLSCAMDVVIDHDEDNPSKRTKAGNILYEGDTVDLTHLPRCFDFAGSLPDLYRTMSRVMNDYVSYQINPSKPITPIGNRMFSLGKDWALPTLERLMIKLDDRELKPYLQFLGTEWKQNIHRAPEILKETLDTYNKIVPRYDIALT